MIRNPSSVPERFLSLVVLFCAAAASAGEIDLLVGDRASNSILRFDAQNGDPLGTFATLPERYRPTGMRLGPQGSLYVSASRPNEGVVLRFDGQSGALLGKFAAGSGLESPLDLLFGPDGNLYVANEGGDNVLRFDGVTGTFIDVFASGGGLNVPTGIAFGADGRLYVNSFWSGEVLRYDGRSGAFIDAFAGGGELNQPLGLTFAPDGNLYVSAWGYWGEGNENEGVVGVLRYDGRTGDFIDVFAQGGRLLLPAGLLFGPDGSLFVAEHGTGGILQFAPDGTLLNTFGEGTAPTFMVLIPEPATICLMLFGLILAHRGKGFRMILGRCRSAYADWPRGASYSALVRSRMFSANNAASSARLATVAIGSVSHFEETEERLPRDPQPAMTG